MEAAPQNANEDISPPFHILALSGGGFRGLYTATILALLEDKLGGPLGRRFDLICGTSVGGIIALALALEIPMASVRDLFLKKGAHIFQSRKSILSALRQLAFAKHGQGNLRAALTEVFEQRTLGEALHPVIIPTVNYTKGLPQVFKTPHHENFERDWKLNVVDIALATSAAPTFLPMAEIAGRGVYVDGGLYANAPGFLGVHEARIFMCVPDKAVRLLSVGTMSSERTLGGDACHNLGILGLAPNLLELMISSQEGLTNYMLKQELSDRYYHIDTKPSLEQDKDLALDLASPAAIRTLTYRADSRYQEVIGDKEFAPFLTHQAAPARFWHGPNANVPEDAV